MLLHKRDNSHETHNNRINFLIAIVFLFSLLIVIRLFDLQVLKHKAYLGRANNQHQTENKLAAERGGIFILNKDKAGGEALYPLSSNKQFALLYAIPKEIKNKTEVEDIAGKLYFVFGREEAEKKVAEDFQKIDEADLASRLAAAAKLPAAEKKIREAGIIKEFRLLQTDKTWLKIRNQKKEEELEKLKKEITDGYLEILNRSDSVYAPLKKKVDEEKLKRFYSLFRGQEGEEIKLDNLIIKNGRVYEKKEGDVFKEVRPNGLNHSMESYRYYSENNIGSHLLGFVRVENNQMTGNYGLEGFFNRELAGTDGSLKSDIGAGRNLMILNDREYVKPKNGVDLVLTIDRSLQFFACQKLKEAAEAHQADSASVVAVDPKTGAIILMCSWPDFDPNNYQKEKDLSVFNNPVVFEQYEPGSVFKAITMGAALNEEKVMPETTYKDEGSIIKKGWKRPIKNADFDTAGGHGIVSMTTVLERSLNTGAIFAMERIGPEKFSEYVKSFGFGERTGVELEAESPGNIVNISGKKIKEIDADMSSFGQSLTVTPLQMLMSYAAIANNGVLMKPYIVKEIIDEDGMREETKSREVRRVISDKAANLLLGMLVSVVESGHSKKAQIPGYYIAGKTGTAQIPDKKGYSDQTIHTFIGIAPADDPKFVLLVKFNDPKDQQYADYTSTPLFKEIADFMLNYYQVPKAR